MASPISLVFIALLAATSAAQAQYTGPSTVKTSSTVAEVLKAPVDDQQVLLRGRLVEKISKDKYRFVDASGEIRVEIDTEDFRGQTVSEKSTVEIVGEVETSFVKSPQIDVQRLTVVSQ